jgi:hypothetical protein
LDVHRVRSSVAAHKTAALLLYFSQQLSIEGTADDERTVTFERMECPSMEEMSSILEGATEVPLLPSDGVGQDDIRLHAGSMEAAWVDEPNCRGFVNFANADFGYGCFISSATQEEILQVCCPEFNVGLIFLGRMSDDEVINVYGKSTQLLGAREHACVLLPAVCLPCVRHLRCRLPPVRSLQRVPRDIQVHRADPSEQRGGQRRRAVHP